MSAITAYARARAVAAGQAQPIATRRHVHVADKPLVFVPLALAGEANAPLAAMVGTEESHPAFLVVPQPRNRDQRFTFAAQLADVVLDYVRSFARDPEMIGDKPLYPDAPQLLLPNSPGVAFTKLFGRSTRFRRPTGPYPVPLQVPLLGRWLTYFAERAEHPGSSSALAMTDALGMHWATGQSALEDANLAALLGWIDPPAGTTGIEAARIAEDPLRTPPAGPSTDPVFDNEVLAPAIRAYAGTGDGSPQRARALGTLERALAEQIEPTWRLMWKALATLRGLAPGDSVAARWVRDREAFSYFHTAAADGGFPQAKRDGAVRAARRLSELERAQAGYDAARAFDDPLIMADHRVTGEAFQGRVTSLVPDRRVPNENGRLVSRPLIVLRTEDPVRLATGAKVAATSRPKQECAIVDVAAGPTGTDLTLEVRKGMGNAKVVPPDKLPRLGEEHCYSSVTADSFRSPQLPDVDATPWTHGGPPQPYVPTDDDAREVWQ